MIYNGILAAWAALCWLWRVVVGWPPVASDAVEAACDDTGVEMTPWMTQNDAAAMLMCAPKTVSKRFADGNGAVERREETAIERERRLKASGNRGGRTAFLYRWRIDCPPSVDRAMQRASLRDAATATATVGKNVPSGRVSGEIRPCGICGAEMRSEDHPRSVWVGSPYRPPRRFCSTRCSGTASAIAKKEQKAIQRDAPITAHVRPAGGWMTLPQAAARLRISRHAVIDRAQRGHIASKTVNGVTVYADVRVTNG